MALLWNVYKAIFYDDRGEYIGTKKFDRKEAHFKYNDGAYNISIKDSTMFEVKGLFFNKRYFQYNLNDPNPILMDKKREPIMNARLYNINLETKLAKQLNDLDKGDWEKLFTFKNIVIVLAILGAVYYFASGGKITS